MINFISILTPIFTMLWYLIPLALLAAIINSAWFKGKWGECQVNWLLKLRLPKKHYNLIKNVTLPTADGTTQIDHLLISKFGIFVLETKNLKGGIFGQEHQSEWTQKLYKHSYKFQNPLRQNYKHLKTLESFLNISPETLFSVIVFIGDSQFKTQMPENVTYTGGCIRYIKSKNVVLFTDEQVKNIMTAITEQRLKPGINTNRKHNAHVKEIITAKNHETKCPQCGAVMVIRTAKQGSHAGEKFFGCSNYPNCKELIKIIN